MTSTLLVLLLLSQSERPDNPPAGVMEPPLPVASARRLHYHARLEATGFARYLYSGEVRWHFAGWLYAVGQGGTLLFPTPDGALRPGAFASLGLGVDHAR